MKKKILANLKITAGLAVGLLLHSCELKEDFSQQDSIQKINHQESSGDMLVLGEQKENPYSVENMQKAYANIISGGRTADFDIRTIVLNAAYECRVQINQKRMQSPFPQSFWAGSGRAVDKLNIRIKYDEGTGRMLVKPFTINEVKIWTNHENGQRKGTDYLYRVTFHELGHSMHARLGGSLLFTTKILRESWAEFIEHHFILAYYPEQNEYSSLQRERKSDMTDGYTPLFIDLMDTENQLEKRGGDRANDRVEKYTFLQLQEFLVKNNHLVEVRDYLKNNYNNPTRPHLDKLFDFYIDIPVK